jgi:protein-L-isoaspartate(D-aspartate) O-methyltransferase
LTAADALVELLRPAVRDARVLEAIRAVPRQRFVPRRVRHRAWENSSLPIGEGQTISQPLVVARMCELLALRGDESVLDVGTGSGYHAAVLARLAGRVVTVERHAALSAVAAEALADVANVELVVGDGTQGHPPAAPYDAINVAAATDAIPPALLDQLTASGRLVIPLGTDTHQRLVLVHGGTRTELDRVAFVPLVAGLTSAHESP